MITLLICTQRMLKMKRLEKLLYHTCTFAVLTSLLFLIFTIIGTGGRDVSISASRYFVIILFSLIISIANMIFEIGALKAYVKFPIHFAVLFSAFFMIFANKGAFNVDSAADFMVVFFVFLFLYALFAGVSFFILKSVKKLDTKLPQAKAKTSEKKDYSPRFK